MKYKVPPLHGLLAFEAVIRQGSLVSAAQELCVTPSAVSHRLRHLEESLQICLFNRNSHELVLTVEGQEYLTVVRAALESLSQFPSGRGKNARPLIRIAVTPTFAREFLVPHLRSFQSSYPDIELVMQVSIPLADVMAEAADLEIRYGAGLYPDMEVSQLLSDEISPVCSPELFRAIGPFEQSSDLIRAPLLRCPLEPWTTWFKALGLSWPEPKVGTQFNDVGLMLDAAAAGQGIALARLKLAKGWLQSQRLIRLYDKQVPSPYAHFLCYKKSIYGRIECRLFIDWLTSLMKQYQTDLCDQAPIVTNHG
jgi:DNA-binding transcriptional LysR family regulator